MSHLGRDIQYAFRTFRRAPLAAVTVVLTVGLGLGLVAMVFTLFNAFFFRADAVRHPEEMFAIRQWRGSEQRAYTFVRGDYDSLRRDTAVFADALAVRRVTGRMEASAIGGALVSDNFFAGLGAAAERGRTLVPADGESSRRVIVLSHSGWSALFASDPQVIGRVIRINGQPYEVVGIMPEGFRGLSIIPPDYWAPLAVYADYVRGKHLPPEQFGVDVIGRLKPGMSPQGSAAGLEPWLAARDRAAGGTGPVRIRLDPRQGTVGNDAAEVLLVFVPLFVAFGLILAIGCANVASLLLARGFARQREIGTRLALGASRARLIRQLLTESLLLAFAAAATAFAISRIALGVTLRGVVAALPPEMSERMRLDAPPAGWPVLAFLVVAAVLATAFFGLVPALLATRIELVRAMRGEITRDARPGRARAALIAVQVSAAAVLLICAALLLRNAHASATADIGLRISDTLSIGIAAEPSRAAIVNALEEMPIVTALGASLPEALDKPRDARAIADANQIAAGYRFVSPEFFGVMDISIARGRVFSAAERDTAAGVAIVSDAASRRIWGGADPIGRTLRLEPSDRSGAAARAAGLYTIVGVARDVAGPRMGDWPRAIVYVPASVQTEGTSLVLRVLGDPDVARAALLERLATVDPASDDVTTMRVSAGVDTFVLRVGFWMAVALSALALVLTLSGLFSVLSYIVEQRTREIGVRIALGASARDVTSLVLGQILRQVGAGVIAGAALAVVLSIVLKSTSLVSDGDGLTIFDPAAYIVSVLGIMAACAVAAWIPARRAAAINPIATLRHD